MAKDKIKKIEEFAVKLLSLMGSQAKVSVSSNEDDSAILVNLDTEEETGLLIGRQGETLVAVQTIL